ncbi:MAG: transglutaminase-like domain-containing protein [Salinibacterium sp.]|nr:transglutaminase-like domain-containing protein [Salinibacterium sp.]
MNGKRSLSFVLINIVMTVITTIIAATTLWPIYESAGIIIVIAASIVLGTTVAVLGARFRWSFAVVLLVAFAAFLAVGVPVAVPAQAISGVLPSVAGLVDLLAAIVLGWKQLLTITLPVGMYEALLVPAFIVVFSSVTIGISIAMRARIVEFAVLPSIGIFIFGTAFGPTYPSRPLEAALALLVAILLWLVWLRRDRRRAALAELSSATIDSNLNAPSLTSKVGASGAWAVLSAALVLLLVVSTSVAVLGFVPPTVDRTVLRSAVEQQFDPRDYVSPLAGYRRYWQPGTVNSVLFEVSGLPSGSRIRLATLDSYDGVVYAVGSEGTASESGSFTRVPTRVDQAALAGRALRVEITIAGQSGVWLPTVGQLEELRFVGAVGEDRIATFFYNDVTGTGAMIGGLLRGDRYTITAVEPLQPEASEIATLRPGPARVPQPQSVPEAVSAKLEEYSSESSDPGERLAGVLAGFARDGYISHGIGANEVPSRSGHSADRISELLTAPRMIGDAEQYAVAAALMATQIGFPTRVVLGFVPSSSEVRGSDVAAWIEVNTTTFGWVAIDPTPPVRDIPEELPVENASVARPQTVVPPPILETDNLDRQRPPETVEDQTDDPEPALQTVLEVLRAIGVVAAGLAILLAPFAAIVATKLRRRRSRRLTGEPLTRVRGGWQEFEDTVVDHGITLAAASTRGEVAVLVGGQQPRILAVVADRATFSPDPTSERDAEAVWRAVDELRSALDVGLTRWQRIKARVSLRSFGRVSAIKRVPGPRVRGERRAR